MVCILCHFGRFPLTLPTPIYLHQVDDLDTPVPKYGSPLRQPILVAGGKMWCNIATKSLKKNRKGHLQICISRKCVSFSPFWVEGTKNPPETQQRWLPRTLGCYSLLEPLQASQVAFQWTAQLCWGVGSCGGLLGGWKAFWISIESKISWDLSRFKFVFPLECLNFIRIRSERARKKAPLEPYKNVPPKLSEFNLYV